MERAIVSEKVKIERKQFYFDLHENDKGQYLRITEDVRGRRDTIIVPASGLEDFIDALDRILDETHEDYEIDLEETPL